MSWTILKSIKSKYSWQNKYIFRLEDDAIIENAIFYHNDEIHICMSTLVGCPIGCRHCASTYTKPQFQRVITFNELVSIAKFLISKSSGNKNNLIISYSGHGEPLLNWENVLKSIFIIRKYVSKIHLTTICIENELNNVLEYFGNFVDIYISLHGSTDKKRNLIIPSNRKVATLESIIKFSNEYMLKGGKITFNYVMTNGNSSQSSARELIGLLSCLKSGYEIRLTPLIPIFIKTGLDNASNEYINKFIYALKKGLPTTSIRYSLPEGNEIGIACGQLRSGVLSK